MADLGRIERHSGAETGPAREQSHVEAREPGPVEAREQGLAELARRQHGVLARRQLTEAGVGRGSIRRRLAAGRLQLIHRGVYAVGHGAVSGHGRWMAAVLACGPDAVLSHRSAGAMWGLRRSSVAVPDVTVPARGHGARPGIVVHRVRRLDSEDRSRCDDIPVTSVARTLLDLAESLRPRELERAIEQAERLRLFDLRAVDRLRERSPGRRGLRPLAELLAREYVDAAETRSELERRFLDLCRDSDLPLPAMNVLVAGFEVDAVWPQERLVVELDGHEFHGTRAAFERDRVRDAALQLAGYRVLRVTYRRLENDPAEVIRTIRSLLQADR